MEYIGYIYKIVNDINDKVYIGQTRRSIKERFSQHYSAAVTRKENNKFHNALLKHGRENFHIIQMINVIQNSEDELIKELDRLEVIWIKKFNSFKNGYNSTVGGGGTKGLKGELNPFYGKHHTYQTKEIISSKKRGQISAWKGCHFSQYQKEQLSLKAKEKYNNGYISPLLGRKVLNPVWTGRKHSEESKLKMSKSHMGKIVSDETKKKLSEANKGKTISEWQKQRISECNLGKVVSDKTREKLSKINTGKHVGKLNNMYGKKHTEETKNKISKALSNNLKVKENAQKNGILCSKKVMQYNKKQELIAIYPSISEAHRTTGINLCSISNCCNNKPHCKTAGGYIWKFPE